MAPNFSLWQIAIVLVIGLLVFGPKKLPELGRGLGSGLRDFRKGLSGDIEPEPEQMPIVEATAATQEQEASAPAEAAEPVASDADVPRAPSIDDERSAAS